MKLTIKIKIFRATPEGIPAPILAAARAAQVDGLGLLIAWVDNVESPQKYLFVYGCPKRSYLPATVALLESAGFHWTRCLVPTNCGYAKRQGWFRRTALESPPRVIDAQSVDARLAEVVRRTTLTTRWDAMAPDERHQWCAEVRADDRANALEHDLDQALLPGKEAKISLYLFGHLLRIAIRPKDLTPTD
jgi:hypothetical protein